MEKRELVVTLSQKGKTQKEIASLLKISRRSVQYILKKMKDHKTIQDHPRSGRPRLLTTITERRIIITSKKDPRLTAKNLQNELRLTGVVSVDTVKRTLRRYGLFGRIAVKKPNLTSKQIKCRLQWCRERLCWDSSQWNNVIFSDECKLELKPNRRFYIRRSIGKRLKAKYIRPTFKFSTSIMVWGAIRGDGIRVLVKSEKNVDSHEYQRILDVSLPHIYTPSCILQQDGAPAHRSVSTKKYFHENNITVLQPWPAQSPDLSIIENLWQLLKERVTLRKPNNLEQLWKVAQEEWNRIPGEQIRSLYRSIPRRLNAVLAAKGGHTKY